jgi:hypothetical protein
MINEEGYIFIPRNEDIRKMKLNCLINFKIKDFDISELIEQFKEIDNNFNFSCIKQSQQLKEEE